MPPMAPHRALTKAGVVVGMHGLQARTASKTVRAKDGKIQVTDGPFTETKEQIAGIYIIDVPDIDAAH